MSSSTPTTGAESAASPAPRPRGFRIATRASTREEFVEAFWRFVDEDSIFLALREPPEAGARHPFRLTLQDGSAVLAGEGEIVERVTDGGGRFGRNGMRLRFVAIDEEARAVHRELLSRRVAATPHPRPLGGSSDAAFLPTGPLPEAPRSFPDPSPSPERTAGSALTLPANPLAELPDAALASFVECVLYEETGPFRPEAEADPVKPPPAPLPAALPPPLPLKPNDSGMMPAGWGSGEVPLVDDEYEPEKRYDLWKVLALAGGVTLFIGLGLGWVLFGGRSAPPAGAFAAAASADASVLEPAPAAAAAAPPRPAGPAMPAAHAPSAAVAPGCVATVTTTPPGARASVGGTALGVTPLVAVAVPCKGKLVLEHPRYERAERALALAPGKPAELHAALVRPQAVLSLTSSPPGAAITLNGVAAGKTPATLKVQAFTNATVALALAGHKPWQQKVYVKSKKQALTASLESLRAKPKGNVKKPAPVPAKRKTR